MANRPETRNVCTHTEVGKLKKNINKGVAGWRWEERTQRTLHYAKQDTNSRTLIKTVIYAKIEGKRARDIQLYKWEDNVRRRRSSSLSQYTYTANDSKHWRFTALDLHYGNDMIHSFTLKVNQQTAETFHVTVTNTPALSQAQGEDSARQENTISSYVKNLMYVRYCLLYIYIRMCASTRARAQERAR